MPIKMTDMRKTAEEKADEMAPWSPGNVSEYPYGLCIRLTESEIERMAVDHKDWAIGDIFDLRALARVTSISENETEAGSKSCVELQIVMMGCEEEAPEDEPVSRVKQEKKKARLYKD